MTNSGCLSGADVMVFTCVVCGALCFDYLERAVALKLGRAKLSSLFYCFCLLSFAGLVSGERFGDLITELPAALTDDASTCQAAARCPKNPGDESVCVLVVTPVGVNVQLCPWIVHTQDSSGCCEPILPKEAFCLLLVPFFKQLCAD